MSLFLIVIHISKFVFFALIVCNCILLRLFKDHITVYILFSLSVPYLSFPRLFLWFFASWRAKSDSLTFRHHVYFFVRPSRYSLMDELKSCSRCWFSSPFSWYIYCTSSWISGEASTQSFSIGTISALLFLLFPSATYATTTIIPVVRFPFNYVSFSLKNVISFFQKSHVTRRCTDNQLSTPITGTILEKLHVI